MNEGNLLAKLALFLWVPVTLVFFSRGSAARAAAWSLLGAVLFLPELISFDLPGIPAFDKQTVATLWALIGCWIWHRRRLRWSRAYSGVALFLIVNLVSAMCTSLLNGDELRYGPLLLPGTSTYAGISAVLSISLTCAIPFFLGRNLYRTAADLMILLRALVWFGLIYSLLILVEVRFSPQLHAWTYGFHQHEFAQTLRGGGYRPMVFMAHGLACAMFVLSTAMAAIVFARSRGRLRGVSGGALGAWLSVTLLLCKSTGAILYGVLCLPLLARARPRAASRLAFVLGALVLLYPGVRLASLLPIQSLVDKAKVISDERAGSFSFRLLNEELLVEKARERLWFGWGSYGRNRVYNDEGYDVAITDSHWAIYFGSRGVVGYVSFYGLLIAPIFLAAHRMRKLRDPKLARLLSGLSLIAAVNVFDLLLNGLFSFIPVFLAGALLGAVEGSAAPDKASQRVRRRSPPRGLPANDTSDPPHAEYTDPVAPPSHA